MSNEAISWAFRQDLPMTEKFVLVALADYADEHHMCYPSHKKTAGRIGASPDTVKRATRRLQEKGFLDIIPWKRDNGSSTSNRYKLRVGVQSAPPAVSVPPEGYASALGAPGTSAPPNNPQLNHQGNHLPPADADEVFARFWKPYPKKVSKQAARRAWDRIIKNVDPEEIIQGAETYAKFVKAERTERKYIKDPDGWLNAGKWEDEIEVNTIKRAFDPWSKEAYVA